jgi:hypothetical protein
MKRFLISTFLTTLAACGSATVETIRLPGVQGYNEEDLTLSENAFRTTVYPIVRQYCAGCHAEDQSPYFANSNLITAHDTLIFGQKVDFNFPSESSMVRRIRDLRHGCWSPDCARDAQTMAAAITEWGNALGDQRPVNPINITTTSNQIPPVLPTGTIGNDGNVTNATTELIYPIANLFSPPLQYGFLKIRVGRNDQSTYLISRPFIVASEDVLVEGMYILMNGVYLPTSSIYTIVSTVIPMNTNQNANTNNVQLSPTPNPSLVSLSSTVLPMQNGPGQDMLSFGFSRLERAP